jgi:hypothetical protein
LHNAHGVLEDGDTVVVSLSYRPAAHGMHDVAPTPEYLPGPHTVHGVLAPSRSAYPAKQLMQPTVPVLDSVYEPAAEYWPEAHDLHAVAALLSWSCSPAAHLVHVDAPAAAYVPDPHFTHDALPTVAWKKPTAQSAHA